MKKHIALICSSMVVGAAFLGGCANGQPTPSGVGTVVGAIGGGAIGAGLSNSNPVATIGGTILGGFIGNRVGKSYETPRYYRTCYSNGRCYYSRS